MDIAAEHIAYQQQLEARRVAHEDMYLDQYDREQIEEDFERAMTQVTIAWLESL
jgi:hypothetical protein